MSEEASNESMENQMNEDNVNDDAFSDEEDCDNAQHNLEHIEGLNKELEETKMALEIANEEIAELKMAKSQEKCDDSIGFANEKIEKLKGIMSLTDESVKHITGGYMQKLQMAEYYKCFPEDK